MSTFDLLHVEDIQAIAFHLPLRDIAVLCRTNKEIYEIISNDNTFWRCIFHRDFKDVRFVFEVDWKDFYRNFTNVWSFGDNKDGNLGLGDYDQPRNLPTQIDGFKAKQVSAGTYHSAIIDCEDNIWTFGRNSSGQLGFPDCDPRNVPTKIDGFKALQVSTGNLHTAFIDLENNVWMFGHDALRLFSDEETLSPIQLFVEQNPFKAQQVATGDNLTFLIDLEHNVWIIGTDDWGQLHIHVNRTSPTQLPNLKAKQVATRNCHVGIIDLEDNVWMFGWNNLGQLGLGQLGSGYLRKVPPTQVPNVKAKQISCGYFMTAIIDLENNLWTFGENNYGQLGLGDCKDRNVPVKVGLKVRWISAGNSQLIAIDMNGNVWVCGYNYDGCLGLGQDTPSEILVPTQLPNFKAHSVSAGSAHTLMIGAKIN